MHTMIAGALFIFLLICSSGAFATKQGNMLQEAYLQELRSTQYRECFFVWRHVIKSQYRQEQGSTFNMERWLAIRDLREEGILIQSSLKERVYIELMKLAYSGVDPESIRATCMSIDPSYLAKEINSRAAKTVDN